MRKTIILFTIALFSGCDTWLSVQGQLSPGSETFTGTSGGFSDGGSLVITSNRGRSCVGKFIIEKNNGRGIFQCTDGQSGPFEFKITGPNRASGIATIGGRLLAFEIASKFE